MLEASSVSKRFGEVVALDQVSVSAAPGRILGLLGPNGAGKTTLIRVVLGIIRADGGEVSLDGRPLVPADKERLGYLAEARGLYRTQTVERVLQYFALLKGMAPAAAAESALGWLEYFGLAERRGDKVDTLSKGMAQKVQFAATVVHDPQVVLFDEPFSGVDPVATDDMRAAIQRLAEQGKSVLFSSHLMDQAECICHDVFVVDNGRVLAAGPLAEVTGQYGRRSLEMEFDGDSRLPRAVAAGGTCRSLGPSRRGDPFRGQVPVSARGVRATGRRRRGVTRPNLRKLALIARKELKATAGNRSFTVVTLLGPFLIAAIGVLPALLVGDLDSGDDAAERRLAIVAGPAIRDLRLAETLAAPLAAARIQVRGLATEALAGEALTAGEVDAWLSIGDLEATTLDMVSEESPDLRFVRTVEAIVGAEIVRGRMAAAGLDGQLISRLARTPAIEPRLLSGAEVSVERQFFTTIVLVMMLYMTIIFYGQATGRTVLQEKLSRTVEIMLSSVSAGELLFGKVIGKAAAGAIQYALWVVMAVILLQIPAPALGIETPVEVSAGTFVMVAGFFLLAFFIFGSLYAAMGAAPEDDQNLTQLAWPVLVFLILPMVALSTTILRPEAPFIVGMSLFPLTAPIVMFARITAGEPATWQIALSIALMLLAILGINLLSARIFRAGILRAKGKATLLEVAGHIARGSAGGVR